MAKPVTQHYFRYGTNKYFRGNAHLVELCTYGDKHDPIGAKAYLDPQNKVKREHVESRVQFGTRVKIDWAEVSQADLEADAVLKFFGLGKSAAASFDYAKAKSARLELINLYINEGPLKTMLNNDADGARNYLADEGGDGRIVSEVWVVVDAELGEQFATYGEATASVEAFDSSLKLTVSGGKNGTQTLVISSGTTFAYKLHKVKDWDKGKTKIEDMEADYKGMG